MPYKNGKVMSYDTKPFVFNPRAGTMDQPANPAAPKPLKKKSAAPTKSVRPKKRPMK